jgi:pSer/pThr/pTyr-binding forkhead associated (FHA) protein
MPRVTITIANKQPQPYRFPLDRDDITLGRGRDNDIAIQSESVSVHHAKMHRVRGGYELRDLGSTNGIKLDDEKKIFVSLRTGMTVRIGEADFLFQLSEDEQEELRDEAPLEETEKTKEVETPKKKERRSDSSDEEPSARPDDSDRRSIVVPRSLQSSAGTSGWVIIVFLILAAIAFFVGMSVRFSNETGGSLVESIRAKFQTSEKPAAKPEPAE